MPRLAIAAVAVAIAAGITQLIGLTVMLTTRATGTLGIASTTGLTITTVGFLVTLATAPLACRALHIWSRDRGYRLYHEHQAQDAAIPPETSVVSLSRTNH